MYRWVNDSVPFAGAAFRQWIVEFYQENRLARDMLEMDGRPVRLANIRCPVLNVAASRDQIAPRATTSIVTERVGSTDSSSILDRGRARRDRGRPLGQPEPLAEGRSLAQRARLKDRGRFGSDRLDTARSVRSGRPHDGPSEPLFTGRTDLDERTRLGQASRIGNPGCWLSLRPAWGPPLMHLWRNHVVRPSACFRRPTSSEPWRHTGSLNGGQHVDQQHECLDGNEAAARVAYALSEAISIYPITPASPHGGALRRLGGGRPAEPLGKVARRRRDAVRGGRRRRAPRRPPEGRARDDVHRLPGPALDDP